MDIHGLSTPELFRIDDLLDLSNEELFSSASISTNDDQFPPFETTFNYASASSSSSSTAAAVAPSFSPDFTPDLCLPSDDVAELEWLSQFVEDSFTDFPSNSLAGTFNPRNDHSSFLIKARSKRSRAVTTLNVTNWTTTSEAAATLPGKSKKEKEIQHQASPVAEGGVVRRCTHCASEKTPQWRTGPLGPKTLCNACGVRYKSGRLVPEYRPAASPTFVLTQHSNSHRKVLELRRQKEQSRQQQQEQEYRHQHRQQPDFEVMSSGTLQSLSRRRRFLCIAQWNRDQKDAEDKKASFSPRPYFRLFIGLALRSWFLGPWHWWCKFSGAIQLNALRLS